MVTTFVFWMSPLGLGFSEGAKKKFDSDIFWTFYTFIFWLGPLALILALSILVIAGLKRVEKTKANWIVGVLTGSTIIGQVSTLIYLTT